MTMALITIDHTDMMQYAVDIGMCWLQFFFVNSYVSTTHTSFSEIYIGVSVLILIFAGYEAGCEKPLPSIFQFISN